MALYSKIKRLLNNTISIYRLTKVKDNYGGLENLWSKEYWNIPCRLYNRAIGNFNYTFEGQVYQVTDKLMCYNDVDIQLGDKVVDDNEKNAYLAIKVNMIYGLKEKSHLEVYLSKTEGIV